MAARLAAVGGVAVAALGLSQAHAAGREVSPQPREARTAHDDGAPLPFEEVAARMTPGSGGCGCSPCWGPPAPPARSSTRRRAARRGQRRTRGAR